VIYGVCTHCSHTQDVSNLDMVVHDRVWQHCFTCGAWRLFRVVRQIEQPDGSVIEVSE
jgi:hypothetical protein